MQAVLRAHGSWHVLGRCSFSQEGLALSLPKASAVFSHQIQRPTPRVLPADWEAKLQALLCAFGSRERSHLQLSSVVSGELGTCLSLAGRKWPLVSGFRYVGLLPWHMVLGLHSSEAGD